jgi:CHAT domain-containing protein/Flp pilus assembly protein TadD
MRTTATVVYLLFSIILSKSAFAQQNEPRKLEPVFSDDFSADTRGAYEIEGEVSWEPGKLTLAEGASISREIDGGAWAEVEMKFGDTGWPAGAEAAEFRIWFLLDGATNCCVRFRRQSQDGKPGASVALIDTGEKDGEPIEVLVRESVLNQSRLSDLQVIYRRGLVRVTASGSTLFTGHISNGGATVRATAVTTDQSSQVLQGLTASTTLPEQRQFTDDELRQLAETEARHEQLVRLFDQGRFSEALEVGEQILVMEKGLLGERHPDYADSVNNLAVLYYRLGDFARAEPLLLQALELTKHLHGEHHPDYAYSLNNLAALYNRMEDYARAESLYQHAGKVWKGALGADAPMYAVTLNNLAMLYVHLGDYSRAAPLLREALRIRKSAAGEKQIHYAQSLGNLALLCDRTGDYARAESLYRQARDILLEVAGEQHPAFATTLTNLASLYNRVGDYARAQQLLTQAREVLKATIGEKHPDYAIVIGKLADLHEKLEDPDRAVELYEQVIAIQTAVLGERHTEYAETLSHLGSVHENMGDYDRAMARCQLALSIRREILGEQHPSYADSLNRIAGLYWRTGDLTAAEQLYNRAGNIWKETLGERHPYYGIGLHNLAVFHNCTGNFIRANELHSKALRIQREQISNNSIGQSARQQFRNQQKYRCFLDAKISNALGMAAADGADVATDLWQWKGSVTTRQQAYRKVASTSALGPVFAELQSVSQRLSVASGRIPDPPPPAASDIQRRAYEQRRDNWRSRVAMLTRQREDLEKQIAAGSREFRDILRPLTSSALQSRIPAGTAFIDYLEYSHNTPDPVETGKVNLERRYVALVAFNNGPIRLVPLGPAQPVIDSIAAFRRPFSGQPESGREAAQAGARLRAQLWQPVEEHLENIEAVIISPDTALGTLPFSALPGRKANSYLIEDYRIALLPFASLLPDQPRPTTDSDDRRLLVMGDVNYDTVLPTTGLTHHPLLALAGDQDRLRHTRGTQAGLWETLPGFRAELETIQALFRLRYGPTAAVSTLSGAEATAEAFLREATHCQTLHIITHGFFTDPSVQSISQATMAYSGTISPSREPDSTFDTHLPGLLSGLVMAGANNPSDDTDNLRDGILRAAEIEASSMQGVDLVVLSACETGLGAVAGGEGLTGLQRAFHIAGARSVIASLWKVDDRATQILMERFYANLWQKGMSKVDALREAQLWMLRHPKELEEMGVTSAATRGLMQKTQQVDPAKKSIGTVERTDPFFWAAFQLSGDWR